MTATSNCMRKELHQTPRESRRPTYRPSRLLRIGLVVVLVAAAAMIGYALGARNANVGAAAVVQQRGFVLPTMQEDGYDGFAMDQNLREVRAVGTTWVELTPTWSQESRTSSEIFRTKHTVSDAGLERATTMAHQYGLKVFLKPHIDLSNPRQDSRNKILPANREEWFASYTAFIGHYAEMAERLGVEQFAMATELSSITEDRTAWLQVIRAVRARYHGTVLYAAGDDYARVPFWDALDLIGIDAYWPLSTESTTDVRVLQQGWKDYRDELADLAATHQRRIVFTEAGFTSQQGTTTAPSDWRVSTITNEDEQAAGYQSLLATFSDEPWWAGVYWWVWNMLPDTAAAPRDFSPRGKVAEWVIRSWWSK